MLNRTEKTREEGTHETPRRNKAPHKDKTTTRTAVGLYEPMETTGYINVSKQFHKSKHRIVGNCLMHL